MTTRVSPLARLVAAARGALGRHPDRAALLLILLVGLAIRLAFTFRAPIFLVHDSVTYFESGYDFARGYGFDLAFKRTPLYPLFIAGVVGFVSEDLQALAFVQHLLGLVTAVLTYWLGRAVFGRLAGLAAGLIVALSGPLIIYEHYILAEALFIPLLMGFGVVLAGALRERGSGGAGERGSVRLLFAAGILLGLAGLTRPVGQAVVLAVPLALLVALGSWRRAAVASLAVVIGFGAVTLPWMVRNYLYQGSFESAGAVGQTLVGRITRHDEGFTIPSPESPSPYADPVKTQARALVLRQMQREARPSAINHRLRETYGWTHAEANRMMRDVCLEILSAQRGYYLTSTVVKLRRLLWGDPEDFIGYHWGGRKSNELREDWVSNATIAHLLEPPTALQEAEKHNAAAIVAFFSPGQSVLRWGLFGLLLLGVVAGVRSRARWAVVFVVLLTLSLAVPAAALVGYVPRYRYPADPFLAVVIGGGLAWLVQVVRARTAVRAQRSSVAERPSGSRPGGEGAGALTPPVPPREQAELAT